jgi:Predicted dehydrogenases and related proteins
LIVMLRIGIVGTGVMGAGHARFIRDSVDGAEVSALFDIDQNKVNQLADELKTVTLRTSNVEDLMNSNEVDAIIIASPDNFHVQHLRLAMLAKKPTLCEKPLATNLDEARAVASEIKEYEKACGKRMIHFGFMRRFDDAYRKARDLINSGNYGSPLYCRTTARNVSSVGVTTSGLYTNIAVHDFDILRWLFKDEWVSVTSNYPKRSSLSPEGLNDPLVVIAKMKNGLMMVADIFAFNNYGYDVRTEVICEKGSIEIGIHGDVITRSNRIAGVGKGGEMDENWIPRFNDSYIAELRAWVETITTGKENSDLATVEDALAANEVCALGVASI